MLYAMPSFKHVAAYCPNPLSVCVTPLHAMVGYHVDVCMCPPVSLPPPPKTTLVLAGAIAIIIYLGRNQRSELLRNEHALQYAPSLVLCKVRCLLVS